MAVEEKAQAERLKRRDEDVKDALEATTHAETTPKAVYETRDRVRLAVSLAFAVAFAGLYYLARFHTLGLGPTYQPLVRRAALGAALAALTFAGARVAHVYVSTHVRDVAARFNLGRVVSLVTWLVVALIVISVLFENWYTAVVSFGIVSLILGFALQTPIMSLIGWLYLLVRVPYKVGDRIRIGNLTGDVIDVGYLDTTLWEFGGEYLSTDHPSGRIIKFPNANVLSTAVVNYSWPLFPYIWNEIKFQVAYQSDLKFVGDTMRRVVEAELGEAMLERVRVFRELLSQTAVDHLEVREHPAVFFRVSDNTWIEAIVRYLVEPKQAGGVKSRLILRLLDELNAAPDKAMFPKADMR
jgi:small-conductance mechanosensitive channel